MSIHPNKLPTELFYQIIHWLPSLDQKTCLSVSKTFHDIAVAYVFSNVSISLGSWRPFGLIDEYDEFSDEEKAEMKRQADASYEIIRHIMRFPDFARNVKRVSVRAFSEAGPELQFAIRFLVDALEAMPELREFFWNGTLPTMPPEILEVLTRTNLRCLGMSSQCSHDALTLLISIRNLTSLALIDREIPYEVYEDIRTIIKGNANTLRSLALNGEVWEQCLPLPSFANLTELDIVSIQGWEDLGQLFTQCSRLRSLSLIFSHDEDILINALRAHPKALLNLKSFKLWGIDYSAEDIAVLARFLKTNKHLRRMDIMVRIDARWLTGDTVLLLVPILEIMPDLPELHVVGLGIRVAALQNEHIEELEHYLPDNLTALLIWTNISSSSVSTNVWTGLLNSRPSLRYLHLIPDYSDVLKLSAAVLENPPPNLELFGYGAQIWPIGRDSITGTSVVQPRWSYPKVNFRTADDYGNEDWEWLLRYHGYDDDEYFFNNAEAFR